MIGTLAEIAIINYLLSFANQGKQTFVFRFHLQQTNGSLLFHFTLQKTNRSYQFLLDPFMYLCRFGDIDIETWKHQTKNGSPGNFP
jgi:hypothetical protein